MTEHQISDQSTEYDHQDANYSTTSNSDDSDDDEYSGMLESIRSKTGLEIGCRVTWPVTTAQLQLPLLQPVCNSIGNCEEDKPKQISAKMTTSASTVALDATTRVYRLELSTCLTESALAPMFDGTQWAGTRVWRAAVVALQYLLLPTQHNQMHPPNTKHTLLELGCGLGVPGMIWHAVTTARTVLTDKNDLVDQLERNLIQNFGTVQNRSIEAHSLDWSQGAVAIDELLQKTHLKHFDVVLNCDCIYEPLYGTSWQWLLECQHELLRRNPNCYVLTSVERRRSDGVDQYLDAAEKLLGRVERITNVPFAHSKAVELYRLYYSPQQK